VGLVVFFGVLPWVFDGVRAGVHRPGLNFHALRHTFETVAGETLDRPAVDRGQAKDLTSP
jgi:hypothetical protein